MVDDVKYKCVSVESLPSVSNCRPTNIFECTSDGNCLFNAISVAISGSEQSSSLLRHLICDHFVNHKDEFLGLSDVKSVNRYTAKMGLPCGNPEDRTRWGTDFELVLFANLLATDIYTFMGDRQEWLLFKSQHCLNRDVAYQAIYLQNVNSHFDLVTEVEM